MRILLLAILAVLVAPRGAAAQSATQSAPDTKYCEALAEKYDAYLETAGDKGGRATPVEVTIAIDHCKSDPAASIPVLEKQLKAARLSLPPRG
jgi:hypothetical protein